MPHLAGSKFLEVDGIRVAASMAYAIGQLGNVDVNEMLIRPTAQSNHTIPPAREGRRRKFCEADKRQILEQAILADACFAEVGRRHWIAGGVLFVGSRN